MPPVRRPSDAARPSRSYDPGQTRKSIIKAGLKLFKKSGFASTAVKDIAEQAGVTKGAFYHHFETKEDLLLLIQEDYLDYQIAALDKVMASGGTATERLTAVITSTLEALEKYHENVAIFFQERRFLTGAKFESVRQRRQVLEDQFRTLLDAGVASGEFRRDLDVPVTCLALIGMCAWSYQWYSPRGRLKLDDVARIFSTLALRGMETERR